MHKLYQSVVTLTNILTTIIALSLMVVVIGLCIEVISRKIFNYSLSGVHEYTGYFLAILSTIGLSQALIKKAHIRIDILYERIHYKLRWVLDIIALMSLCKIALLLTIYAYPVLKKSIDNSSLSNTPLATPLWIPQVIWYIGIIWFCVSSFVIFFHAITLIFKHKRPEFDSTVGAVSEAKKEIKDYR